MACPNIREGRSAHRDGMTTDAEKERIRLSGPAGTIGADRDERYEIRRWVSRMESRCMTGCHAATGPPAAARYASSAESPSRIVAPSLPVGPDVAVPGSQRWKSAMGPMAQV